MRRHLTFLCIVFLLAACADSADSPDAPPTSTATGTPTTAPDVVESTTPETTDSPDPSSVTTAPTTTSAASASSDDFECLIGTWELDGEAFATAISQGSDSGAAAWVSGTHQITLGADGRYEARRDEFTLRFVSPSGDLVSVVTDPEPGTGTWTARSDDATGETVIEFEEEVAPVPSLTQYIELPDGSTQTITAGANEAAGVVTPGPLPATCDGGELRVTAEGFESLFVRRG